MDLTTVRGRNGRAQGQLIYVLGTVLDENCQPVPQALVEIWQACASGKYNHPGDSNPAPLDPYFQYWGRSLTNEQGRYLFKSVVPGAYPAGNGWIRPPHIHFKVHRLGFHELTTQMYFAGNKYNTGDRILSQLPPAERNKLIVPLEKPVKSFEPNSFMCRFNLSLRLVR